MAYPNFLANELVALVRSNRFWMTWNLLLAAVPALLALVLFARAHRRTAGWWVGVVVFTLFLPNAPYVVTDLIHLRGDAAQVGSDGVVVAGVLPLYGAFITTGLLFYVLCTELIVREVRTVRPQAARWQVEAGTHLMCAIGIMLGRVARLNSWDTVTAPTGTVERMLTAFTWWGAPVATVAIMLAIWASHLVVRTLAFALADTIGGQLRRWGVVPLS